MPATPKFNVSFTLVRQREDDADTKWRVEESHQRIEVDGDFFDEPDVMLGEDAFGRRMIAAIGVPAAALPGVLDAGKDLGGFLDMRKKDLRDEIRRRLYAALGMPAGDEA